MPIPEALKPYAMRLGFPESKNLTRIFEILFDGRDDIKLIAAMPGTIAELAQRTGLPEDRVRERTHQLKMRGAIHHLLNEPRSFRLFPAMIELRDSSCLWPEAPHDLKALWDKLITEETPQLIPVLKKLKIPPIVRVLPIERSIEMQNTVLDIDSARKIFRDADLITVIPCVCRAQAREMGRGKDCPAPATSVCMQTHAFSKAILDRGLGEKIGNEEALKRIGDAEDAGLVHMVRNNIKHDMFMCNCCSCCCTGLFIVNQLGYPNGVSPSRFRVKLDTEACSGCGICEDRCQFQAISMVDDIASINHEKCYGCGNCVITCPDEALTLEEIRPKEHIRVK